MREHKARVLYCVQAHPNVGANASCAYDGPRRGQARPKGHQHSFGVRKHSVAEGEAASQGTRVARSDASPFGGVFIIMTNCLEFYSVYMGSDTGESNRQNAE